MFVCLFLFLFSNNEGKRRKKNIHKMKHQNLGRKRADRASLAPP